MSVAREVTIDYDLQLLAEAASQAGYIVTRGVGARDYWGESMKGAERCDLVISSKVHKFDMGFVRQPDGTIKMFADEHGGHVKHDLGTKIMPRYMELMLERDRRYRVTHRAETKQSVTLTVQQR